MNILGIETSCDETAAAIYSATKGLQAHQLYSQIDLHRQYGGVVPELASRDHVRKLLPLIDATLAEAKLTPNDLDGIAFTKGPGLVGALLVGATIATSLAWAWHLPVIGIHHLEAHLLAVMLEKPAPSFPFLTLLVSGGHTMLIAAYAPGHYQILGETLDDAVGEAFDKTAKLLNLPYPGGPALAELAKSGNPQHFTFPRPMMHHPNLDFSFSGLKTYAINCFHQVQDEQQTRADIARAFEDAVVDILWRKSLKALQQYNLKRLVVAGGVGANQRLREQFTENIKQIHGEIYFPRPKFCTDNGAMVAYTGYVRLSSGQKDGLNIEVKPRWDLTDVKQLS